MNERWKDPQSLRKRWNKRTELLAEFLDENTRILEFGAGRGVLVKHLKEGCIYRPSDIYDRGNDNLIYDLNEFPLPEFQGYDVAFFSGVFEYLTDLPKVVEHLSEYFPVVICSYIRRERYRADFNGFKNHYSIEEFMSIFNDFYYATNINHWNHQVLFKWKRK
jgi:hypothetical protein